MRTRKFNLSEARAGKTCVTVEGHTAEYKFTINNRGEGIFHVFHCIEPETEYAIFVNNLGECYSAERNDRVPSADLEMLLADVQYWVATAECAPTGIISSCPKTTEELSIADIKNNCPNAINYSIQTHKITRYE